MSKFIKNKLSFTVGAEHNCGDEYKISIENTKPNFFIFDAAKVVDSDEKLLGLGEDVSFCMSIEELKFFITQLEQIIYFNDVIMGRMMKKCLEAQKEEDSMETEE